MTHASPLRWFRRVLTWALTLGLAWVCFGLFEPVLVWSWGWRPLPSIAENDALPSDAERVDADWRELAAPAVKRLREARAKLETPALSAAISVRGKLVWAGAVGLADVESHPFLRFPRCPRCDGFLVVASFWGDDFARRTLHN